jgi:hypothetical protein
MKFDLAWVKKTPFHQFFLGKGCLGIIRRNESVCVNIARMSGAACSMHSFLQFGLLLSKLILGLRSPTLVLVSPLPIFESFADSIRLPTFDEIRKSTKTLDFHGIRIFSSIWRGICLTQARGLSAE